MKFSSAIALAALSSLACAAPFEKSAHSESLVPTATSESHYNHHWSTGTSARFPIATGSSGDVSTDNVEKARSILAEYYRQHPHATGFGGSFPTGVSFPSGLSSHGFPAPSAGFHKVAEREEEHDPRHHLQTSGVAAPTGFAFPSGGFSDAAAPTAFPGTAPHHIARFAAPSGGFAHASDAARPSFPEGTHSADHHHASGSAPAFTAETGRPTFSHNRLTATRSAHADATRV